MAAVDVRTPSVEDLLERVETIRPIIEEHAPQSDEDRCLSDAIYDAFRDAGLHRMMAPAAYGGYEMHPVDYLRVLEPIARIDTAASWNLGMSQVGLFGCWIPQEGADELYADGPDLVAAGAFFPPGGATPVDGGWRVTGRVPYVSGSQRATWFMMPIVELDGDGEPIINADTGEPDPIVAFFPREDVEVIDTWNTIGMRGTHSGDFAVDDVFVPTRRTGPVMPMAMTEMSDAFSGPLYQMHLMTMVHAEAVASIGAAESGIAKLVDLAATKVPAFGTVALKDREMAQHHAAKAKALVGSARNYLHHTLGACYDDAVATGAVGRELMMDAQLAACHAAEACAEAVGLVHEASGASGIRIEAGMERHLRDVQTLTQHASKSYARYESVGQWMFGLPITWLVLAL